MPSSFAPLPDFYSSSKEISTLPNESAAFQIQSSTATLFPWSQLSTASLNPVTSPFPSSSAPPSSSSAPITAETSSWIFMQDMNPVVRSGLFAQLPEHLQQAVRRLSQVSSAADIQGLKSLNFALLSWVSWLQLVSLNIAFWFFTLTGEELISRLDASGRTGALLRESVNRVVGPASFWQSLKGNLSSKPSTNVRYLWRKFQKSIVKKWSKFVLTESKCYNIISSSFCKILI